MTDTYALNNRPVINCWRCGQQADVVWVDISTYAEPDMCMLGQVLCTTPGCVDEDGSNATSSMPPTAVEIQRKANSVADRFWAGVTR